MKMPGLSRNKTVTSSPSSTCSSSPSAAAATDARNSIWSRSNTEDVSCLQLQKFWNGLSSDARRNLLRIDKQTLFEQVRKNLYCSRCHGLLVEGFSQIITYGKNLSLGRASNPKCRKVDSDGVFSMLQDDARDPSLHPWGGLAATRDCMLTVLDCFLDGMSLEVLQNVFESARARERERELLYPDACGGNGRGWISQTSGMFTSGRGHGMKETCALHTVRLSCEALVDFWSALSEETRRSLLRMKEEDFIERLMFRFDSKRFCRDCRRNVLREFKEMKELKRARKEPRCTRWFCAADTTFQYEVSDSAVQADWRESFAGEVGTLYQHFEWALGTGEGKADIFGFEDVGLSDRVQVEGLELGSISDCFITLRAWRRDGRCIELSAKAHALRGELCVHRRLFVGDGVVSITEGDSIQRFFEHAEETEEEEDEDAFDKDGSELDGEGSRSQKHAKSPELARDFLLDAATVIFKEQVEKAFREGTARQNAHSIFVCLSLGLLEDRVRVACKEIATLEKQNKLLEEEEHEKREEEERRERRKLKEKEKKLRRKEKLKCKEREKEKKNPSNGCDEDGVDKQEELVPSELALTESLEPTLTACSETASNKEAEDMVTSNYNGAFIVEQSKAAKRRSNCKRHQLADTIPTRYSRRGAINFERGSHTANNGYRQDAQQCACSNTFWVKGGGGQQVTRKATLPQVQTKAGVFKVTQKSASETVKARKEGLSYTKVVTRGLTENQSLVGTTSEGTSSESQMMQVEAVVDEAIPYKQQTQAKSDQNGISSSSEDVNKEISSTSHTNDGISRYTDDGVSGITSSSGDTTDGISSSSRNVNGMASSCGDTNNASISEHKSGIPSTFATRGTAMEPEADSQSQTPKDPRKPVQTRIPYSVSSPAIGSPYAVSSNGYVNGFGPVKNHPYMVPHPPPVHHHHLHHAPPPPPLPPSGFACYPVHHAPWPHHQPRGNFMQPIFIPGPAFGYPRYPVPRLFHPPVRIPEMINVPPRPYPQWMPPTEVRMQQGKHQQQQEQDTQIGEKLDESGFSFFHFGGPSCGTELSESPGSSCTEGAEEEEVVVSSKCMDRLPSGISKPSMIAGEYSLFAAAPGKGFGFF